ncbi:hypothetical protein L0Y59_00080 [Candidatus Uhrbacteria bacterium]|nr:hypothetical protein [Candidatus Uhrbacteria bacterium]
MSTALLFAVTTLLASTTVLMGCDGETTETKNTVTTTTTTTTGGNAGSGGEGAGTTGGGGTITTTTSEGGTAGSGGNVGGSAGSPVGGAGGDVVGGSGGSGGDPVTGGSGGTGGDGGTIVTTTTSTTETTSTTTSETTTTSTTETTTTTTSTTTTSTTTTTSDGGAGGATTTSTTTSSEGGAGGFGGYGGFGGETTTTTTTSTTTTLTLTSDGGAGGFGGEGGAGGSGGSEPQCPVWQSGSALTCGTFTTHTDPDLTALNLVWSGQALSDTDVFVVGGTYPQGKIVRYDGTDWVPQTIPDTVSLSNVLALSATEAYAVGRGPKWGYDCIMLELSGGSTWTTVAGTPTNGMYWGCTGLWAEDSSDMFLLATDTVDAKVYRGPKSGPWTEMTLPSFTDDLRMEEIWGSSVNDVWAVGALWVGGELDAGVLLHYDGNANNEWVNIPLDGSVLALYGVSGTGPCDVAVTGIADDNGTHVGVNVYYDGNAWSSPSLFAEVNCAVGIAHRAPYQVLTVGTTNPPFNTGKIGVDDGNRGLAWQAPLAGYGYLRNVVTVPNSDTIYVFAEESGVSVLSTWCN